MKTLRLPLTLLGLLYACFIAYLITSAGHLPDRVATHFNGEGQPNDWMSRSSHVWFMGLFGVALPLLVIVLMYVTRFLSKNRVNIPHRDYWLAPERRLESCRYMFRQSVWLACLLVAFITGIHFLIVHANRSSPPQLSNPLFLGLLACFLVSLGVWIMLMFRRFHRPA